MECEVCGNDEGPYIVLIEGARLHTCSSCSRMGKILAAPQAPRAAPPPGSNAFSREPEFELVEGYGRLIAQARMKMRLPLQVLAERLAEKESFLERVEHEKARPPVSLARRLEKELGVSLLEEASTGGASPTESKGPNKGVTLGDILEIQRKKKKE